VLLVGVIVGEVGKEAHVLRTRGGPHWTLLADHNRRLPVAAGELGGDWAFGVHEALDQFGATFGPLVVALVLLVDRHDYHLAFALLAIPAVVELGVLGFARVTYPRPVEFEGAPQPMVDRSDRLPRRFWVYLAAAALVGAGFAELPPDRLPLRASGHRLD